MSGLFTKNNLSESGLNAVDAVQKLYEPQVQEDINLFAFASRIESSISSGTPEEDNQIYGLLNEPTSNSLGQVFLRTKFITNASTFSDNNLVWIDKVSNYTLDRRTSEESSTGAPVKFSVNGSVVNASFIGSGTQYEVRDGNGAIVSNPGTLTVDVNLLGIESGANNCVARVLVNSNGTISRSGFTIIQPGSGYIDSELLQPIPACYDQDDPLEDKCFRYSNSNNLYHVTYNKSTGGIGYSALLRNEKYQYRVRFSRSDGFFLYDETESKWVYLGGFYDNVQILPKLITPALELKRYDRISSENLIQLYKLNANSLFFSYVYGFRFTGGIGGGIRSLSDSVENIRFSLQDFIQNCKLQALSTDTNNTLGINYNTINGKNILSDFRMIFRDPDGVLDDNNLTFFDLRDLDQPDELTWDGKSVPGIWLFTGEKYQRIFSSDDKPFFSQSGKSYLSPILFKFSSDSVVAASESGDYKYSISTGYYKEGQPLENNSVRGFDTTLGTLIQNLSGGSPSNNSGFVYHRSLSVTTIPNSTINLWPLLSYKDGSSIRDANFLAI